MKRIFITGFALLGLFRLCAQNTPADSTAYKSQRLKIDEINLVSSYYKQDGIHSAVTGGIGSEELTDVSNTIDIKLIKYGDTGSKHSFDLEVGVDHYTSASSDQIDLNANSSASSSDNRIYPSLTYSLENEEKGRLFGIGVTASTEYDYKSTGANIEFSQKTADKSGEFSAKFQAFLDKVKQIRPIEFRITNDEAEPNEDRNTYAASLSYSQIINKNFQVLFIADAIQQQGYLGLPFHRVYFDDGSVHQENLPDSRFKLPLGFRASYFVGDNFIIKAYYRYYADDWKLTSHTASIEIPVKLSPFFSLSPFYRYYTQSAAKYFREYGAHTAADQFYTSNFDLSEFDSSFFGMGLKLTPLKGIFGIRHFNTVEIRYGHYTKTTDMTSDIISINLKYR